MAAPDSSKHLQYSDLIQLVLFPDGSPLSSRLKNAAVLQQVFKQHNATHEQAVAFASRVNAYAPWWLRRQLGALQEGKSTWEPEFSAENGNRGNARTGWQSRATKQLELLLFEGLEKLVGFKGEVKIKQPDFLPLGKKKSHQDGEYMVEVFIEDASGVEQGPLEGSGMMADEDADSQVFEVTNEDSMLLIQVKHAFQGLRYIETELLGQLKVSLPSLPSNAGLIELKLPMFAPYNLLPIPVYKVHRNEVLNSEKLTQTGFLHCSIAYSTDASRADPQQISSENDSLVASSPGQAMFGLVHSLARQAEAARGKKRGLVVMQKMQGWLERHTAQGPRRAAIREKWIEIINKALLQKAMLSLRSKANTEVLQAMERSPVFSGGNVEEVFLELMDQVWNAWLQYGNNGQLGTSGSTRSLDSLPTMINPSLGTLDFEKQPLYKILREYDRYLAGVVADPALANVHVPGMPFFHLLFVFAMMRGISPWLMKLAMAAQILKRLGKVGKVEYRLLRLLMSIIKEAHTARKQQLLTATEEQLCLAVTAEMKAAAKTLLNNHYELIPPDDAYARKFLLQEGNKYIGVMDSNHVVSTLTKIAEARMKAQLEGCDINTIQQILYRFRNAKSYEEVRGCLKRLGKAWADAAGDFEATLGLKLEAPEELRTWLVEDLLVKHYTHLCEAARSIIHNSPFWPYDETLGYDAQDLQRFQDGVERMYDVMVNYGLAKPPKKARASLHVDALQNGSSTLSRDSQLAGFVQPTFKYKVKIFTGRLPGADTDSQVFIDILGDVKSSGKCALTKEKLAQKGGNNKLFEWGGEDEFMVPVQGNLGNLNEIQLSTDGKGRGPSWYVDRVEITDMAVKKVWYFNCQAWLSESRGNSKLEQVFGGTLEHPSTRKAVYTVEVKTSDIQAKGTITKVHIAMYGSSGENHQQWLPAKMKTDFARGQYTTFSIECLDLCVIEKIRLGIRPHTLTPSQSRQSNASQEIPRVDSKVAQKQITEEWPVDYVIISNTKNNARWLFQVGDKFTNLQPNWPIEPIDEGDLAEYRVSVTTADNPNASLLRGKVHLQLEGIKGKSGLMVLDDPNRDERFPPFQRGRTDRFSVLWKDLGQLKSLRLWHDGVSRRDFFGLSKMTEWHVNKVAVVDVDNKQEYTFRCDFTLLGGNAAKKVENPTVNPVQVRTLVTYQVTTHTSNIRKAGTDAHVYLQMFGENNLSSERQQLVNKKTLNLFEMGQVDDFIIKCPDLGSLQKIVIEHDNSNFGASWHLNRVEIVDTSTRRKYVFTCDEWLSDKHGGCKKVLELDKAPTASQGQITSLRDQWTSRVELLGWVELMSPQVQLRVDTIRAQRFQVIERRIESYANTEWKPVNAHKLHAAHVIDLTRDMVELLDACEKRLICSISHSRLRAEVTIFTLLDIIQPAAIKVATYLQLECLKELHALHLPGLTENIPRGTLFQQSTELLTPLCIRLNTLVHNSYATRDRLERLKDTVVSGYLGPNDRKALLQCYDRVYRSVNSKAGSVLAELRSAMRFSFARGLEVAFEECKDGRTLDKELRELVCDSFDDVKDLWLNEAEPMNLLYNLYWSSLLEAVQCMLLGLSVWSLPSGFQLTVEQAESVEAALKTLELHFDDTWRPAQSLMDATQQPYMRCLLRAPGQSSRQLYSELLECYRDEVLRLNQPDARQRQPYFGTEVVVNIHDVMELQQQNIDKLQVLDFIRVLRSRTPRRGEEDYRSKALEHVKSLHQSRHMQVLFGLPFRQALLDSQVLQLSHKHPEASRTNRRQIHVIGQLFIFTSYIAFTTLLHSSPESLQLQQSTAGVTHQPLVSSDYTALWHANEDVLHVEFVQNSMKLMMTLSDHSVVELWLAEKGQVYKLKECYQQVRKAMGLPADSMEEPIGPEQESCNVGFQSCFRA